MQDRIHVTAIRECMIVALFTDVDNREIARKNIDMKAGESRGDIQFVLGLFPDFTDFPGEYDHFESGELVGVPHPHRVGETTEAFGVLRLTRLP
jgi:hypothetical protein